ncbi:MAG: DoxX family membrane protein [Opitutales bacterium]
MNKAKPILRIMLGLALLVFGLNKFFGYMPAPELPEQAQSLMGAMSQSGYLMQFVGLTETVVGILLLSGFFVPLALVIFMPVSLNIIAFHLFLAPGGILPGLIIFLLNLVLMFLYLPAYRPLLRPKPVEA